MLEAVFGVTSSELGNRYMRFFAENLQRQVVPLTNELRLCVGCCAWRQCRSGSANFLVGSQPGVMLLVQAAREVSLAAR